MDTIHHYAIQNTNGQERVNFNLLFEKCHVGSLTENLLKRMWHYINYFDDVTLLQEKKFLDILYLEFGALKVDKHYLIRHGKVDKLVFDEVYESIKQNKIKYKTEECVWIDHAGYYYFVFGMNDAKLEEMFKIKLYNIDSRFFKRMNIKTPSLFSLVKDRIRKGFNVRKV